MHYQLDKELALVQTVYGQNALKTRFVHFVETTCIVWAKTNPFCCTQNLKAQISIIAETKE